MAKEKKKSAGRPTKYHDSLPEMLIEFFSKPPYSKIGDQFVASDFPTIAAFACEIGVHRDSLFAWKETHPEWKEAMARAKDYQERYLTVNGLKSLINPSVAIFTMKNVCGWRDQRQEALGDKVDDAFSENYATWEKRKSER